MKRWAQLKREEGDKDMMISTRCLITDARVTDTDHGSRTNGCLD